MQPLPLTRQEIINVVRHQVAQFEEIGLAHEAAVLMVARTHKVEPHKIAALAPPPGKSSKERV
jgi:hypothetical protein